MIETIRVKSGFFRFDRVVALVVFGYGMIAAVIPEIFFETVLFTASAMVGTAPFITFAVLAVASPFALAPRVVLLPKEVRFNEKLIMVSSF